MKGGITKVKALFFVILVLLPSFYASAINPYLVELSSVYLGEVLPGPGDCELDVASENLSGVLCTQSAGGNGHYRITADPGVNIQIRVDSINDSGDGIVFAAEGIITTDSAADADFVGGSSVTVNSGVSGVIHIYVAGRLTLNFQKSLNTVYTPEFDIEFNEI